MIDIDMILEDLKADKTSRSKNTLDTLNSILEQYYTEGNLDFSITQIGRVSSTKGGPGYESIRATKNEHFRRLIESWAAKAGTTIKKPLTETSRSREVPTDYKLLERINDAALRALFGQIIAERNRLKKEVNLLKHHANIVIDKRPVRQFDAVVDTEKSKVELISALSGVLTSSEVKALTYAISEKCMENRNWQFTLAGQVKDIEYNEEIFPRGFVTGIQKIIGEMTDG